MCLTAAAAVGPPRDYLYTAIYPEWMTFGRGVTPVVADAATYVCLVALGHAVMRRTSRLLQPAVSEARRQVALDRTQQTGPDSRRGDHRHS